MLSADGTCLVTLASSDWALDHLMRSGGKGYLPRRYVDPLLMTGNLHLVDAAPTFTRRVYVVQNVATVRNWPWYEAAITAISSGRKPTTATIAGSGPREPGPAIHF